MKRKLTVYYTSDTHGYFDPVDYAANTAAATGLSNCAANFIQDGNSLILDGGDVLQGSPFTYWMHQAGPKDCSIPAKLMNLAGYQFITLGNHDFNYGRETLEQYLNGLDAVCLCANVEGLPQVRRTAFITLENGLRVGLTGIVTDFINIWEKPEHLTGVRITDPVAAAGEALRELKAGGCDLTVCIYHGGFEADVKSGELLEDTGENRAWQICRELDFNLLLTGHQHMALEEACIAGTWTCQPPDKAKLYIRAEVEVSEKGEITSNIQLLPAGDRTHPAMEQELCRYTEEFNRWLDTPVGHLDIPLQPEDHLSMAIHGSPIANFFNQVQLDASGADISVTCLGNEIRGFDRQVSIRDVVATYIYPNTLRTIRVNRECIRQAIERSAEYFSLDKQGAVRISEGFLKPKVEHYNFDYFSGIEADTELSRPFGERVLSIRWKGEELDPEKELTLCMNNYRATGTGGYECYKSCPAVRDNPTEIVELIMDYVSKHRNITVDQTKWLHVLLNGKEL